MSAKRTNIPRPYNGGQWTSARFFGFLRSSLRSASTRWNPKHEALRAARTGKKVNQSTGRIAMHHRCAMCGGEFPGSMVAADHIIPCGSLRSLDDLPGFVARLFCEADGFRVLCHPCHKRVTDDARDY